MDTPGASDVRRAAEQLASRLPAALASLARLAFNYRWSWAPGGEELFAAIDAHRWQLCQRNPVRLLQEAAASSLERAAADRELVRRSQQVEHEILSAGTASAYGQLRADRPVVFFCAEYAVHPSLPIYAGGLGVLAGDLLKEASDRGLPLVGVGLLYRKGYFRQQIDTSGWQHEYWVDTDPERLPGALVTRDGSEPLTVAVPIRDREVVIQIWRVDVGRAPLYLLDADRPENRAIDRWITARLYVGDREIRLTQYALLGLGGVRAMRAMGIEPGLIHLNEGHAALAPLELAAADVATGRTFEQALASAKQRTVFTTHTPVGAGNETYSSDEIMRVCPDLAQRLATDRETLLGLGRIDPENTGENPSLTPLALRLSRSANGVSRRHGEVARSMWARVSPARAASAAPIGHVTNAVHVPTWMASEMRELLDRYLGADWRERATEPATWAPLEQIPDEELWATRRRLRTRLVENARERATVDRLARGESLSYVELAANAFDPDRLTIGFARRLAGYKRLHLLSRDLSRSLRLLTGEPPVQMVLAGKAHPQDDGAKRVLQIFLQARTAPRVGDRIAYLHDYDMEAARSLVAGCDVWISVPRPPLEASGTSGMKAALNGGLNVSVLDGWWAEGYDGTNGWAIDSRENGDVDAQDSRDANALADLLEREVVPLFHERDRDGLARRWLKMVRSSIRTAGLRFSTRRMLDDYVTRVYFPPAT